MDLGSGIAFGISVLGGIAVIFRIFPGQKSGNPGNPEFVSEKLCSARLLGLKELVEKGFKNLSDDILRLERKIDHNGKGREIHP